MTETEIAAAIAADCTVRLSESGGWYWCNVSRSGHSWSHRLPKPPAQHDIEDARASLKQWLAAEEISEDT